MAEKKKAIASLWLNQSERTGTQYYSGVMEDEEGNKTKVVGFLKKEGDHDKAPDIKLYVSEERGASKAKSGSDTPF